MIKLSVIDFGVKKVFSFNEFDLYWQYKNELWKVEGCIPEKQTEVQSWYFSILHSDVSFVRIYDTKLKQEDDQVGFLFIARGVDCHKDADSYIWDAFVLPDYRRQKIMSDAFQVFIQTHPGRYCLYLIDNNLPAIAFWKEQFDKNLYEETDIDDYTGMETDSCHLHCYEKA